MWINFHDVPEDWFSSNFNHGLWFQRGFFGKAGAKSTGKDKYFHSICEFCELRIIGIEGLDCWRIERNYKLWMMSYEWESGNSQLILSTNDTNKNTNEGQLSMINYELCSRDGLPRSLRSLIFIRTSCSQWRIEVNGKLLNCYPFRYCERSEAICCLREGLLCSFVARNDVLMMIASLPCRFIAMSFLHRFVPFRPNVFQIFFSEDHTGSDNSPQK